MTDLKMLYAKPDTVTKCWRRGLLHQCSFNWKNLSTVSHSLLKKAADSKVCPWHCSSRSLSWVLEDYFLLLGLSYTGCTLVRSGIKADDDSLIVKSMRIAGAIPLCATNTPELCSGFECTNPLYGLTVNPYDGRHSAGGSSGGEVSIQLQFFFLILKLNIDDF